MPPQTKINRMNLEENFIRTAGRNTKPAARYCTMLVNGLKVKKSFLFSLSYTCTLNKRSQDIQKKRGTSEVLPPLTAPKKEYL